MTHQLQKCQGKTSAAQIAASIQGKVQTCLSPIHDPQTLANRLTDLTNQVGELVNAPNETMYKTNVVEAANRFVSELKHSANGVQQLRQQIKSSVRKINKYLKEYEKYNRPDGKNVLIVSGGPLLVQDSYVATLLFDPATAISADQTLGHGLRGIHLKGTSPFPLCKPNWISLPSSFETKSTPS